MDPDLEVVLASVNPLAVAVPVVSQGFVAPGIP